MYTVVVVLQVSNQRGACLLERPPAKKGWPVSVTVLYSYYWHYIVLEELHAFETRMPPVYLKNI